MPDYQGNSKKQKEQQAAEATPAKAVDRVTVGEVIVRKRSLGHRVKDIFVEADFKTVVRYVGTDILIPAARDMLVNSVKAGVDRWVYGDAAVRRRGILQTGPRIQYHNPVNRAPYPGTDSLITRFAPQPTREPRSLPHNRSRVQDFIILSSREEASLVLERMQDLIEKYDKVTLADLHQLIGQEQIPYTDNKWGWTFLGDVQIRQVQEGFLLDLPPAEPMDS